MRHRSIRALVAIGVLGGGIAVLAAQQKPADTPADPQQPPRFRVDANFVRVDVYPTRGGQPVFDLKANDFEVHEDGVLQKIETFEHVVVRPAGPQAERVEVPSQRESLQAAANPRNRVFIIFLDTPHVMVDSAHRINEPLIRLLNRILGPDDLVGVMTPEMSASQMVLGRRTTVIEESLRVNWPWGTRFSLLRDEREEAYIACYPTTTAYESPLAREMIQRKRERATLEAIEDLVRYLRTIREERKAILVVSEGWLLFEENRAMMRLQVDPLTGATEPIPSADPVVVGPNGKFTTKDPRNLSAGALTKNDCDTDRIRLAAMDNEQYFRDIMDEANYANASFYPIDPRGLPAFDHPIGPEAPPPISVDAAMLRKRIDGLKTLAGNTDGVAVTDSNDLDGGLKRISDDLTSYYLLGYYSSNAKLDGRFRSLKVRVKQPGVEVRSRRGYRSATLEEVTAARRASEAPVPESTRAVNAAIDRLGRSRADARFRVNAVANTAAKRTVWVAGELQSAGGRPDEFAQGGTVDINVAVGPTSTSTRVALKPGERTFLTSVTMPDGASGDLSVRARLVPPEGGGTPLSDSIIVDGSSPLQPLFFRRGVTTGNRLLPAADLRFSRTERVRVELPADGDLKPGAARLLDRGGQPLQVPVAIADRLDDSSGQRWITADVALGALAPGDYAIELDVTGAGTSQKVITAIRVVR